tara:strand:+ start:483 stop:593 length:111 start_codon:yes stop_codon:yes gene_type:complete
MKNIKIDDRLMLLSYAGVSIAYGILFYLKYKKHQAK